MAEQQNQKPAEGQYHKVVPEVQVALQKNAKSHFGDKLIDRENARWNYGLTFECKREHAKEIFAELKNSDQFSFDMLTDVTAVDWLDKHEQRFELVYQLLSLKHRHRLAIKIRLPEAKPEADTVRDLWPTANFMEREVFDMYGIQFAGHGDLRRILLYDEFVGYPLRKDYPIRAKQPRVPLRIPELRNTSADMERGQLVSLPVRQRLSVGEK